MEKKKTVTKREEVCYLGPEMKPRVKRMSKRKEKSKRKEE